MSERERLIIALYQLDNIVSLTENNEWKNYLYNYLSPVKYELERQLNNLTDTNVYTKIEEQSDEDND
jgi:hypothetical protein|tara:strand:+ start:343 stop:543 length:201 start_codon:yes stop_codon:yes gene_type:complete